MKRKNRKFYRLLQKVFRRYGDCPKKEDEVGNHKRRKDKTPSNAELLERSDMEAAETNRLGTSPIVESLLDCLPESIGQTERKRIAIRFTRVIRDLKDYHCNICGGAVAFDRASIPIACWGHKVGWPHRYHKK